MFTTVPRGIIPSGSQEGYRERKKVDDGDDYCVQSVAGLRDDLALGGGTYDTHQNREGCGCSRPRILVRSCVGVRGRHRKALTEANGNGHRGGVI